MIMKHIPNAITIIRLFLVPLFIYVFFSGDPYSHVYALVIYLIAGITDLLDGYLARKYKVVSVVGTVLDPLADKLMLLTALWCLAAIDAIPFAFFVIMIVIEGFQILSGIYLYTRPQKAVIPANKFGKSATVLFALAVSMMVLLPDSPLTLVVVLLALVAKIVSFTSYMILYLRGRDKGNVI
jgi:cardiolipin synthase